MEFVGKQKEKSVRKPRKVDDHHKISQVRTIILHHDICISVYFSLKIGKYDRIPLGFPIYAEQTSNNRATEACKTT